MAFSILLFEKYSPTLLGKTLYISTAIGFEIMKLYLFLESKKEISSPLLSKKVTGFGIFIIYLALAITSAVASIGFSMYSLETQEFAVASQNLSREGILYEINSIDEEISNKQRQQSELPGSWITASQRVSADINSLRERRFLLIQEYQAIDTPQEVTINDTFSIIGQLLDKDGKTVLFYLLMSLVILLEVSIPLTSGSIKEEKDARIFTRERYREGSQSSYDQEYEEDFWV